MSDIISTVTYQKPFINFTYFHHMHMNPKYFIFTILLTIESVGLTIFAQANPALIYQFKKHVICRNGAVVSAHPLASIAGIQMLEQGGNAVDAAIATQLALAVVYPGAGNIGGGGFMVARLANGSNITVNFREKAPDGAYRNMYLDANQNVIPGKSENGHLAVGVPGSVSGIFSYYKYAKLSFNKLIGPAIDLAEKGFAITAAEAADLNEHQEDFKK